MRNFFVFALLGFVLLSFYMVNDVNADSEQNPVVLDSEFQIEEFVSGLFVPVNMEFIGDDLLVLEKNTGTVRHIQNNILLDSPVLDVEVSNYGCLLYTSPSPRDLSTSRMPSSA